MMLHMLFLLIMICPEDQAELIKIEKGDESGAKLIVSAVCEGRRTPQEVTDLRVRLYKIDNAISKKALYSISRCWNNPGVSVHDASIDEGLTGRERIHPRKTVREVEAEENFEASMVARRLHSGHQVRKEQQNIATTSRKNSSHIEKFEGDSLVLAQSAGLFYGIGGGFYALGIVTASVGILGLVGGTIGGLQYSQDVSSVLVPIGISAATTLVVVGIELFAGYLMSTHADTLLRTSREKN